MKLRYAVQAFHRDKKKWRTICRSNNLKDIEDYFDIIVKNHEEEEIRQDIKTCLRIYDRVEKKILDVN